MVAKINRGVSLYGAVIYNQRKVDEATARIIAGNRMITDLTGNPHNVMQQTLWQLLWRWRLLWPKSTGGTGREDSRFLRWA